jgi:hypothetical protein
MNRTIRPINGIYTCQQCQQPVSNQSKPHLGECRCSLSLARSVRAKPGAIQKAANFATSAAKHVAAGMPQCSDAERERRFAICQGCEFYDGSACSKCGCPVVRESRFVSKLSWANEKCPVGKWGPESVG